MSKLRTMTSPGAKPTGASKGRQRTPRRGTQQGLRRYLRGWMVWAALLALVVALLYFVFRVSPGADKATYDVGSPGLGERAPAFTLPATTGQPVSLADYRGKTVLLYFHEGGGCQPCWDQIRDLEKADKKLAAAGIEEFVAITTDPAALHAQKLKDDRITTIGLSDPDLRISKKYHTNEYGMMGTSRNGHSFLLIDPSGRITWRADYGGAPDYTMYVPVDKLLTDLNEGRKDTA